MLPAQEVRGLLVPNGGLIAHSGIFCPIAQGGSPSHLAHSDSVAGAGLQRRGHLSGLGVASSGPDEAECLWGLGTRWGVSCMDRR